MVRRNLGLPHRLISKNFNCVIWVKNTTKSDVYRVTLENGTSTLGYTESGNLIIEIPTSDGNYKKEVFKNK